jgi:hypothetical protein
VAVILELKNKIEAVDGRVTDLDTSVSNLIAKLEQRVTELETAAKSSGSGGPSSAKKATSSRST